MSECAVGTILNEEARLALAKDKQLGAGNFLWAAAKANPNAHLPSLWLDRPFKSFRGETFEKFSLKDLKRVCDEYAALYHSLGVQPKDPIAVYIDEGVENLIHFVALTALGAIPILINGKMRIEIAAGFIEKARAQALFTDEKRREKLAPHLKSSPPLSFLLTAPMAAQVDSPKLPDRYPFIHHESDIVLVGHSSGTTGIPKAVIFEHQQFFHGPRYRLGLPLTKGSERTLSALPHSHSAGLAYVMLAILNGSATLVLSDNSPSTVIPSVKAFQPSMVVAFPETFVRLCEEELKGEDFDSVKLWVNGGDAAHEAHIRKLIALGSRTIAGKRASGSVFIDGLGSSEMGFSLFRMVHTTESNSYNRCIGHALEWVDAAILGENGEKLPPNVVGKLGVKSPTITPGYWNESLLTARAQLSGYWLTGDLFYQDEEGRFFHVDRIPDVIRTQEGPIYSLQTEEFLLHHFEFLSDCTVIGVPLPSNESAAVGFFKLKEGIKREPASLFAETNRLLKQYGRLPLRKILIIDDETIPLGPTGKVLKQELRKKYQTLLVERAPVDASTGRRLWAPINVSA